MQRIRHSRSVVALLTTLYTFSVSQSWAEKATYVFETASQSIVTVNVKNAKGQPTGLGSGVVIGRDEIVTNCHVIEDGTRYTVKYVGREYEASAKHTDWERDVCSLRVPGLAASPAPLGSTRGLKVGQKIYVIGAPQGLELTLSEGIIAALREVGQGLYLQITAPISPGSSGGGLFDEEGRLIGLPTFYLKDGQQLNFAVPVEWVQTLPQRTAVKPGKTLGERSDSRLLAEAKTLVRKQDWAALLRHSIAWTRSSPKDASAWFYLGVAYRHSDQTAKAIEAYQQALRIDPQDASTWRLLGIAYRQSGQSAKAIEAYQQVLRIDPQDASTWRLLGHAYDQSDQTANVIEAYQQALHIDPQDALTWRFLGGAYRQSGQSAKAIEAYQQALRIDPQDASTWRLLGHAYDQSDQTAQVIEAYQQALRIDSQDAIAWLALGIAYHYVGRRSEVMDVYHRLKTLDHRLADKFFEEIVLP